MTEERYMNLFAKSLLLGFSILLCDVVPEMNCMPTNGIDNARETDDMFEDKVEIFKRDVLHKLGYARPPIISNVTRSIEENRRMIQQYRKYIEEKNKLHYSVDSDQQDWEDEGADLRIKSKTFYSVQYEGM